MTAVIIWAMIFANVGLLATASRMLWAFAREKVYLGTNTLHELIKNKASHMGDWHERRHHSSTFVDRNWINCGLQHFSESCYCWLLFLFPNFHDGHATVSPKNTQSMIPWDLLGWVGLGTPMTLFSIAYSAQGMFFSF